MRYKHRERTIQLGLLVFCCLFIAVTSTEVSVDSQSCIVPHVAPPPKFSWHTNQQVTVRIDDSWNSEERGYFQEGIEKWNQALNCSGVLFHDFSSIHFASYSLADSPPDFTIWWQRTSPLGVRYFFTFPQTSKRLRAAIVPILPEFQNSIGNSFFVYLGTHEIGHTFDLDDCLASNNCQSVAGTCSIMGGQSQSSIFNTGGPLQADNAAVDYVYCPEPCEQFCDLESCGLNCIPLDPCSNPDTGGCPPGYSGGFGRGCCSPQSPIVVDLNGDGVNLTDAERGVVFDIAGVGTAKHMAWTVPDSDDGWLVLDRNHNGTIDDGSELFGNFTPQPIPAVGSERNGFRALAEYDKPVNGGNDDTVITNQDSIFVSLRLWHDANHNGISEASELRSLSSLGITAIELAYKASPKVDQYGNSFRYRAKITNVHGARVGRWAWDVFLISNP